VAIGRAIIRRPKVFLFDEPLSNLDAKLRSQMRIELQKLHREINATMIYVTHDQVEAMTLGTRIAVLKGGKLMQLDTPMQVYNNPANRFVAGFIGSPAMNFIKGSIQNNGDFTFISDDGACNVALGEEFSELAGRYIGSRIILGIRPEHISWVTEDGDQMDCSLRITAFENMGNEQLVYFESQEKPLIIRRAAKEEIGFGEVKRLFFQRNKIVFLNAETGDVLTNASGGKTGQ
jgi:multiple sugar transport system ATP-binding protein